MGLPYATRDASDRELLIFRLLLSIYRDGSGAEREKDGTTRANWRQIERCVADLLNAITSEDKNVFDVIAKDIETPNLFYGYSVKTKQLTRTAFNKLSKGGRVYMEIANSPAKFWAGIYEQHQLDESSFRTGQNAQLMGESVLSTVRSWHLAGKALFERLNPDATLDIDRSNYFCLSYSQEALSQDRRYQIHIFDLEYPRDIIWRYTSDKCLRGYDPAHPDEAIFDWYGLSGGQLKYYPSTRSARFASPIFKLELPPHKSALDKVAIYFPELFDELPVIDAAQ